MKEKRANPTEAQETTKRAGPKYHISSNNPIETISIRYFPKETITQIGFPASNTNINTQGVKTANPKKRPKKSAEIPVSNIVNNNNNVSNSSSEQLQMDMSAMFSNQSDSHDPRYIWISIRNQESKSAAISYFMVLKNTPLKNLQQTYSKQHGVPPPTFLVNGIPLPNECSPDQLGLRDGTVLQISLHASPGSLTHDESDTSLILRARYKQSSLRFKINKVV